MEFAIKITPDTVEWVEAVHGDMVPLTNGLTLYFVGSTDASFLNLVLPEQIFEATFDYVGVEDREAFCWVRQHEPVGPNPPTMDDEWDNVPAMAVEPGDRFVIGDLLYVCVRSIDNARGSRVIDSFPVGYDKLDGEPTTLVVDRFAPINVLAKSQNK